MNRVSFYSPKRVREDGFEEGPLYNKRRRIAGMKRRKKGGWTKSDIYYSGCNRGVVECTRRIFHRISYA